LYLLEFLFKGEIFRSRIRWSVQIMTAIAAKAGIGVIGVLALGTYSFLTRTAVLAESRTFLYILLTSRALHNIPELSLIDFSTNLMHALM
jgi:hypothetical protein